MRTEPELLNERLDRLALVLDEIMPNCANLVRDALDLLKEQRQQIWELQEQEEYLTDQLKEQNNVIEKANSMLKILKDKINELLKEQKQEGR